MAKAKQKRAEIVAFYSLYNIYVALTGRYLRSLIEA